ncbi:MAG: SET domain-containing protein [Deltaproteobacteria bacterium]|nr:SET domain-containing protein [Deltaproteobacteria bacterium]
MATKDQAKQKNTFIPKHIVDDGVRFAPTEIKEYYNLEVKTRDADGAHKGLFTRQDIKKGAIVARDGGRVLSSCEDMPRGHRYAVFIDEDLFLYPAHSERFDNLAYFNHSCSSNIARIGGLIYVAKIDIDSGEELFLDYAPLIAGDAIWEMKCHCASPNCRQVITHEDWKIAAVARDLWTEWLPHIQKRVLEEKVI